MRFIVILKLIVVSFLFTTILACRSVKKERVKDTEVVAAKEQKSESSLSANHIDSSSVTKYREAVTTKVESNVLGIEYTPTFNPEGQLIPFYYDKTDSNGNTTKVNIVGPAKVTNSIISRNEEAIKDLISDNSVKIDQIDSTINILRSQVDSNKTSIHESKKVAPDYLKYIIWMGFSLLFLAIVIVAIVLYFRAQITKLKSLLP